MNRLILLSVAILISGALQAQDPIVLKAPVTSATLFPDRAQLQHSAELVIPAGTSILLAEGLPQTLLPSTIRVEGKGDFMIMAVNPKVNYLAQREESEESIKLRRRINELQSLIENENTEVGILKEREAFLTANRVVTGGNATISADQLRLLSRLYATDIEEIRKGAVAHSHKIRDYEEEKRKLENQLSDVIARKNLPGYEVFITVSSAKQTRGHIDLSYLVRDAGWFPSYDIRVTGTDAPATIFYKANAWQNSGFEWKNIDCTFSSATPTAQGTLPVLNPWFLGFTQKNLIRTKGAAAPLRADISNKNMISADDELMLTEEVLAFAPPVNFSQGMTNFSFNLKIKQDIPSGSNPVMIELQRVTTDAFYRHVAIPKIREEVYLTAGITDWESLNLLDGEANIYFGNRFTGKSMISVSGLTDTLEISLGPDNSLTIKREKRKDITSTRLIGSNREETRAYLITIRNNRNTPVTTILNDQIPLSTNNQIAIEPRELSGGSLNSSTGRIRWELSLAPNETKEVVLEYRVKFPKGESIVLER